MANWDSSHWETGTDIEPFCKTYMVSLGLKQINEALNGKQKPTESERLLTEDSESKGS